MVERRPPRKEAAAPIVLVFSSPDAARIFQLPSEPKMIGAIVKKTLSPRSQRSQF
jgi:hypothetical protein